MVNWEFYDNQTPQSARELVDGLRSATTPDELPQPTRGGKLCTWRQVERVLAGFPDGGANDGPSAGPASLVGLELAHQRGERAPDAAPAPRPPPVGALELAPRRGGGPPAAPPAATEEASS